MLGSGTAIPQYVIANVVAKKTLRDSFQEHSLTPWWEDNEVREVVVNTSVVDGNGVSG